MMNQEKLLTYSSNHNQELIQKFEQQSISVVNIPNHNMKNDMTEKLYFMKNKQILDSCYIEGNSDIKNCIIYFSSQQNVTIKQEMISLATHYALDNWKMQEVFAFVPREDAKTIRILEKQGYESLGIQENNHAFVKDAAIIKEREEVTWRL